MNMDLDAATKEAPTLTLDPFARQRQRFVRRSRRSWVEEQAVPRDGTDTGRAETGG